MPKQRDHHNEIATSHMAVVERLILHRGLRLTPLRREVLGLIIQADKPVKAYELLGMLRKKHHNAAPTTVYRTLNFLLEHQFIHQIKSIRAFVLCHHPETSHQMPFLICTVCSDTHEIHDSMLSRLIHRQAKEKGFYAHTQMLEVHGICGRCHAT